MLWKASPPNSERRWFSIGVEKIYSTKEYTSSLERCKALAWLAKEKDCLYDTTACNDERRSYVHLGRSINDVAEDEL